MASESDIASLAEYLYGPPPERVSDQSIDEEWSPSLNPVQREAYNSTATYILCYGERGTGKSIGALHKLVKHCWENQNALAIVIVGVKRQAEEGGAWQKLQTMVLPEWRSGRGIEYRDPKTNVAKDVFIWMTNRHGGWSRILLLSMPVGSFVADRVKGIEASFMFVDEGQTLEGSEKGDSPYFKALVQQLGRVPNIPLQQIIYCANPAGPTHWLYQRFFVMPVDEKTKVYDTNYAVFHVPISENIKNLPPGYYEKVMEACRGDDIEYRRMVLGEWVDRPEADALFVDEWKPEIHVKGSLQRGESLMAVPGHDIILGWDPGAAHTSIHLQQRIRTATKCVWLVLDEINLVDRYTPYVDMVPMVIRRMQVWCELANFKFRFRHVSDSSAFNQFRALNGSFDAQDIELISREYVKSKGLDDRFIIRMLECPKAAGSVEARVRGAKDMLRADEILVSCICVKTISMFSNLEEDPKDRMHPKRSKHIHPFDSLTYPHLYYRANRIGDRQEQSAAPQYYPIH